MARPVMVRPQTDASLVVLLLVVPAERFDTGRCGWCGLVICALGRVEPDRWEVSPASFDTLLCRALALIRNHGHVVASRLERRFVRDIEQLFVRLAVVRQPDLRALGRIPALAQPFDMGCERLPNRFVIVEHAYLAAHELN